jgi:hypothetical protein
MIRSHCKPTGIAHPSSSGPSKDSGKFPRPNMGGNQPPNKNKIWHIR